MEASMKMMNNVMPLMSVVFCFTLPTGLGIYWVASAVVRMIQQIIVNKQIDKIDLDEMIQKNVEKNNEKRKKMGLPASDDLQAGHDGSFQTGRSGRG